MYLVGFEGQYVVLEMQAFALTRLGEHCRKETARGNSIRALENDERFNLKGPGSRLISQERLNQLRAGRSKVERNRELNKKRLTRLTGRLGQSVPANESTQAVRNKRSRHANLRTAIRAASIALKGGKRVIAYIDGPGCKFLSPENKRPVSSKKTRAVSHI